MGLFSSRTKPKSKPCQTAPQPAPPQDPPPGDQGERPLSEDQARLMAQALSGLMKEK